MRTKAISRPTSAAKGDAPNSRKQPRSVGKTPRNHDRSEGNAPAKKVKVARKAEEQHEPRANVKKKKKLDRAADTAHEETTLQSAVKAIGKTYGELVDAKPCGRCKNMAKDANLTDNERLFAAVVVIDDKTVTATSFVTISTNLRRQGAARVDLMEEQQPTGLGPKSTVCIPRDNELNECCNANCLSSKKIRCAPSSRRD